MSHKKTFILIGIFWLVVIGGFISYKEFTLRTGQEVLLKTRPVDPRDLFRGDYVILSYEISRIDTKDTSLKAGSVAIGDNLYVLLSVNNNAEATLTNVSKTKPEAGLFLKGTIKSIAGDNLNIEYGIESYFVPEGEGRVIERELRNMFVKVAIDKFGQAGIKALVLEGEEIDL